MPSNRRRRALFSFTRNNSSADFAASRDLSSIFFCASPWLPHEKWFTAAAILAGVAVVGLGGVIWVRHRAVPSEAAAPLSPEERGRLDTLLREADC